MDKRWIKWINYEEVTDLSLEDLSEIVERAKKEVEDGLWKDITISSDSDSSDVYLNGSRLETDLEMENRVRREKLIAYNQKNSERLLYEKLKSKFEKPNG